MYNTTPDEAQALVGRIGSIFHEERIRLARLGPALGAMHTICGSLRKSLIRVLIAAANS